MKQGRSGYELLIWMGVGIGAATLLANRLFASGVVNYLALYEYVVQGWKRGTDQPGIWPALWILIIRLGETMVVSGVCLRASRSRKRAGIGCLFAYSGLVTGLSIVLMTWNRGVWGIFYSLTACLPHYLFYLAAWGLLIFHALSGYGTRTRRLKFVVMTLLAMGIFLEWRVGPVLLTIV